MAKTITHLDALIIGAGFSGLYALHHLRTDLGLSARVYEAADGVGGTDDAVGGLAGEAGRQAFDPEVQHFRPPLLSELGLE